jgi:hypothetical protein
MKNNDDNLSAQPRIQSEINSQAEMLSNNEGSVHIDEKDNEDVKSETYQYPHVESVGDTELFRLNQDSTIPGRADLVTTAAVNSSISTEIAKINSSLEKLLVLTSRSDSQGVHMLPEVS